MASFREFTLHLGGINLHIQRFFSGDFSDLSIWIMMRALGSFREVARSSIEMPILIKITGFIYECHKCGRLGCNLNNLLVKRWIQIFSECIHLSSFIYLRAAFILAPFLEPLIEFLSSHWKGVDLGYCI
jgi:hypothetical protein